MGCNFFLVVFDWINNIVYWFVGNVKEDYLFLLSVM